MGEPREAAELGRKVFRLRAQTQVAPQLPLLGERQLQVFAARGEQHQRPLSGGEGLRQDQLAAWFLTQSVGGGWRRGQPHTGHARADGDAMTVGDVIGQWVERRQRAVLLEESR